MRTILTILLIFLLAGCRAQCDTVKVDTSSCWIHSMDTTSYYNYYHGNGVLLWKDVKGYDATLIPKDSGYAVFTGFVNPYYTMVEGFAALRNYREVKNGIEYCYTEAIFYMDKSYKKITKRFITPYSYLLFRKK